MTDTPKINDGVGRMSVHSTLWQNQQTRQLTDLAFYYRDGTVSAHSAIMAGVVKLLAMEPHKEEIECLIIPAVA